MLLVGVGAGEGGGEGKNVIRTAAMPKSQAFTAFRLFAQHAAQGCGASMPWATMPNAFGIYSVFCLFVQHTVQVCGARRVVTSIHAFGDHAASTDIYSVFARLYNILCKDGQQDALSQAYKASAGPCRKCKV